MANADALIGTAAGAAATFGGPVGIAAAGALELGKGVYDIFHNAHLKKLDEAAKNNLKQPFLKVQDEYYQNRNSAEQLAAGGLPESTKNFLTQKSQSGLSTALNYLKQAGGSPDDVSKLFSTYADSISSTAAADSEQHLKNIQYYWNANQNIGDEKTKQYGVNELQPYENKLSQLNESIAADKQNQNTGFNTAIGGLTALGTSSGAPKIPNYQKLFGNSAPFSVDSTIYQTQTPLPDYTQQLATPSAGLDYNKNL